MQVENIRLTPGLKALGFQLLESTSPFKVMVSDDVSLHPYIECDLAFSADGGTKSETDVGGGGL